MIGFRARPDPSKTKTSAIDHPAHEIGQLTRNGYLALGLILIVCGALAIAVPETSTRAAQLILGGALTMAGIVTVAQSLLARGWVGFNWQLFSGVMEFVGGVIVYLHPVKGVLGATLFIAVVFFSLGIAQASLAFRLKPQRGWIWFLASGVTALATSILLVLKLFFTISFEPGFIIGLSLALSGVAYCAIALFTHMAQSR